MTDVIDSKLGRRFDALDADHDGYVEWSDHQRFVDRCLTAYNVDVNEREGMALQAIYQLQWCEILRHAKTGDQRLTKDEYVDAVRTAVFDTSRLNMTEGVPHALFDVMDTNDDDLIDKEEFERFLRDVWGTLAPEAMEVFTDLDTDKDGHISRQEFVQSVRELYHSTDPTASGSKYFGRV